MSHVQGYASYLGQAFRSELNLGKTDREHGNGRTATRDLAALYSRMQTKGEGKGPIQTEGSSAAVQDPIDFVPVDHDRDADQIVLKVKGDLASLRRGKRAAEPKDGDRSKYVQLSKRYSSIHR